MGKIATEQEAARIGYSSTSDENKCCTKSRAEQLNCVVNGDYESNQLVQLSDLQELVSFDMQLRFELRSYNFEFDSIIEYNLELEFWLTTDSKESEHISFMAGVYPTWDDNENLWNKLQFQYNETLLGIKHGEKFRYWIKFLSGDPSYRYPVNDSKIDVKDQTTVVYDSVTYKFEDATTGGNDWTIVSDEMTYNIDDTTLLVNGWDTCYQQL